MSGVLWSIARRLAAALDAANGTGQYERAMRLMEVTEEAEASAAYIGMTDQNPRKGISHTTADVVDELCDVGIALGSFTDTPAADLTANLDDVGRSLNATRPWLRQGRFHDVRLPSSNLDQRLYDCLSTVLRIWLANSMRLLMDGACTNSRSPRSLPFPNPQPLSRTMGVSQWTVVRSAAK